MSSQRLAIAVACLVSSSGVFTGCGDNNPAPAALACETADVAEICAGGDPWACRWRDVVEADANEAALATFAG
ncbi:MAG: hypothetical protein KJO07_15125, partial [Deltaproteobacteria bacterium]|nr:hypothetical protein [Deltaproteobacteria bacterium]